MFISLLKKHSTLLLGTWVLRATNDNKIPKGLSYLIVNDDNSIKFRTLEQNGILGIKKSISGEINNLTSYSDHNYLINLNYSHSNTYSYSLIGVEIPEIKSKTTNYILNKNYNITILDKSLLINDNNLPLYYLFDLYVGKIKSPFVETGLNTLVFTQLLSFILNLMLVKILHNIFF